MPLLINLRHLENKVVQLGGELSAEDLDLDVHDELVHVKRPLRYNLEAEKMETGVLVRGELRIVLDCECARCLKPFPFPLELDEWVCHLPLEGDEKVPIISDCVDLTPFVREDILLEFPQHPLCRPECGGLQTKPGGKRIDSDSSGAGQTNNESSAWAELNKLKL